MSFVDNSGLKRVLGKLKLLIDNKVSKSGDTMTGRLTAPEVSATSYLVTPTMVGEGNTNTYYHRIDFGKAGNDKVDFYEYGGIWNFYQNTVGTKDGAVLIGSIQPDGWHGNVVGNAATATKATSADTVPSISDTEIEALFTSVFG